VAMMHGLVDRDRHQGTSITLDWINIVAVSFYITACTQIDTGAIDT
jgi:hypothetical protein